MKRTPFVGIVLAIVVSLAFVSSFGLIYGQLAFSDAKNMKVVKAGEDVYIVFQAINKTSKQDDIYLSSSHDAGKKYDITNLSNGKVLLKTATIEEIKNVEQSFNPQIAMDKGGGVYVAWNAKAAGNPSYVVLAISEDKFQTPVIPFVNMTNDQVPGTEPLLVNDEVNGGVNLYYITTGEGPADPCKTRCG
jgi:hypothetical protein